MNEQEIQAAPVAGWEIRAVAPLGIALVTLQYLASPMESLAQAHASPNFALTPMQLRELAQALERAARVVESSAPQAPPGPKH